MAHILYIEVGVYIMSSISFGVSRIWPVLSLSALLILVAGCGGRSGEVLLGRGIKAFEEKEFRKAEALIEKAAVKLPDNPSVYCNLGIVYWKDGQYDRAVTALRRAVELTTSEEEPLEFLGNVFIDVGNWDDAFHAFEQAMERSGRTARLLTAQSVVKLHTEDLIDARRLLSEALACDPSYTPALYNMAVLYRDRADNAKEAAKYFRSFLDAAVDPRRMGPPVDEVYITSAEAFVGPQSEDLDVSVESPPTEIIEIPVKAIAEEVKIEKEEAKDDGRALIVAKLLDESEKAIEREEFVVARMKLGHARKIAPDDPEPLWQLAVLYDKHLDFAEKAEAAYREFKTSFPDDRRSKLIVLPSDKAKSEALKLSSVPPAKTEKAAKETVAPAKDGVSEVDEDIAQTMFDRAFSAHQAGDWDDAISGYKKALEHNSKLYNAIYNMGLAYKKKDDLRNAKALFLRSTEVQPDLVKAWYMLALVHKDLKEYDQAISSAEQALKLDPGYGKTHFLLGLVYSMKNRPDLAKRCFLKCIECSPGDPLAVKARENLSNLPR